MLIKAFSKTLAMTALLAFFAMTLAAQTTAISGKVKGADGQALQGALVKITRTDIKGNYQVKTNKKGEYFHAGLPLGTYNVSVEVEGRVADQVSNVRPRLGDPTEINFDLQAIAARQAAMQKAAEAGQLTEEQKREMSPEQRAAVEKTVKERSAQLAKNKALNDAFNAGMAAMNGKQWQEAIDAFTKASEMDAKQHVVWANLAESYVGMSGTKTGADQEAMLNKGLESWQKALELKMDDSGYHNNFALALAKAKKFKEAEDELAKAAALDPPKAGTYYYNLGAILVNTGQIDPAGVAFKKAIEADPNHADAQYQYGVYLISKATVTPEGKVVPPDGTKEAFEKYLQLKPDGPFAASAKGMIETMQGAVQTEYTNPDAKGKKGAAKKK